MIRITGYGVIAEKLRVGKLGQFFPVGKTMRWIKKMNDTFYDGHGELYHHAKFGEDGTIRAGCRCENVVFFVCLSRSESGAPCVRGLHSSNKLCAAVYSPISTRISAFFQNGLLFQIHYIVHISVARWRHNVREIAVNDCENPKKSVQKFVRTTSYR